MTPGVNTVDIGASAAFQCSPEKNVVATITWSKEEGSLPSGRYSILKGALYITNTTVGDNGMYVCTISRTDQGTAQASVTLNVKGNHLLVSRIKVLEGNISKKARLHRRFLSPQLSATQCNFCRVEVATSCDFIAILVQFVSVNVSTRLLLKQKLCYC